jgi:hypothetical protein
VRPRSADPIELLFDQLRARRLAAEQKETYVKQQETALQLRELNEATLLSPERYRSDLPISYYPFKTAESQGLLTAPFSGSNLRLDIVVPQMS